MLLHMVSISAILLNPSFSVYDSDSNTLKSLPARDQRKLHALFPARHPTIMEPATSERCMRDSLTRTLQCT